MLFTSLHFIFFFPVVVFLYFIVPYKYRWVLLLLSSYYFYMSWKAEYALLLLVSTLVSYFSALFINYNQTVGRKKLFLIFSLLVNLGLLFVFKYFNFFNNSFADFLNLFKMHFSQLSLKTLLPLGISFFTFQSISYVVDVYRGKIQPEKHLGIFAVYLSFFPRLVLGPIERAGNLLPQFFEKHNFGYGQTTDGLKLMAWGFLKKLVIADGMAFFVDRVYNNLPSYSGPALAIATFFYAVQIYCDFSGYTDIALGSAQVLGYRLMDNFLAPYSAKSISEFWQRWHISLSSWFRDYLYIPLGGNRVGKLKMYRNLMIVFLVSGLWHGANWTYVIWGALHGFYMVMGKLTEKVRLTVVNYLKINNFPRLHSFLQTGLTFLLVCFAWIFFRANSLSDVWYVITHLFTRSQFGYRHDIQGIFLHYEYEFAIIIFPLIIVGVAHWLERKRGGVVDFINSKGLMVRWIIYCILIMAILLFGSFGSKQFIYFNF